MTRVEWLRAHGIRRLGTPKKGFRYVDAEGRPVAGAELERVKRLRLPPAWTQALLSPDERPAPV